MRPNGAILVACAAAATLAHDISNALHSHEMLNIPGHCHSPTLRSFPLLSSPVCGNDTLTTKYQASHTHSGWTRASSCISNANGTDEYCIFTSTTFAGGRGITVVTSPQRADYLASLPSFTRGETVLKDENTELDVAKLPYEFVHVPGKDLGVVAKRPIYRGEHLMSFTPAMVVDYGAFDALELAEVRWLQGEAVEQLPPRLRGLVMNLSTHDEVSGHVETVAKIMKTNSFAVDLWDENDDGLYFLFPEISRFNHDCRPNTDYWFDPETLVQHIYATRDIYPGEELSVSYINPILKRAKRQKKLQKSWGFQCTCAQCRLRPELSAASDERIKQIRSIRKQLEDYSTESTATPKMADLLVSLYQQERLDGSFFEAYAFAAIEWNGVGEPWEAVRYARLAIEHGLISVGSNYMKVVEMKDLAADPWGHWSWLLRTSKRMSWGKMRDVSDDYSREGDDDE